MPELPEVETVKNILIPLVKGKKIDKINIYYDRLIQSDINEFKEKLIGETFLDVTRYGKFLFLKLTHDLVIVTHLRMEGKFRLAKTYDSSRIKSTSLTFYFSNNEALSFDDTRKFGLMYLSNEKDYKEIPMIKKLGIEANKVNESDYENLYPKFNRNKPIKELLLDQSILCGIGNIYADEICYASKVNPFSKANTLSKNELNEIFKNTKIILEKAIELGGSTIHSFHPSEGIDGKFQNSLLCYGHVGKKCPHCSSTFRKDFLNGRGTTFCPNCQINKELEKAIGLTGPIGSGKSTLLEHFRKNGYITYSCDALIHSLYQDKLHKNNISKILKAPFDIDNKEITKKCREIMINSPELKKKVEDYIYPVLEKELINIVKNNSNVIIEAPTLFKAHIEYLFKQILVIEISQNQQEKNLISRNDDVTSSKKINSDFYYPKNDPKIRIVKATGDFKSFYKNADLALKD